MCEILIFNEYNKVKNNVKFTDKSLLNSINTFIPLVLKSRMLNNNQPSNRWIKPFHFVYIRYVVHLLFDFRDQHMFYFNGINKW